MKRFLTFLSVCTLFLSLSTAQAHTDAEKDDSNQAFLGIESDYISRAKADIMGFENPYGVIIEKVVKNSAADRAGLQPFDYLYKIEDYSFSERANLGDILDKYRSGDEVTLYFIRKNTEKTSTVRLGDFTDRGHRYTTDNNGRPFLGVSSTDDKGNKFNGVRVNITDNSTAEKLGMQDGDIITYINGYRIVDWGDITLALRTINNGEEITVVYMQNGAERRGQAQIGQRNNHRNFESRMETFGERMEEMGERIGERAEDFGEQFEDKYGDRIEDLAEDFGEDVARMVEGIFGGEDCGTVETKNYEEKAFLGVYSDRISRDKASFLGFENRYGSYITRTIDNTAAQKAKLQPFDYVYGIDEYRTGENQSLGSILHKYTAGEKAEVVFIRDKKTERRAITFVPKSEANYVKIDECDEPFLGISHSHDSEKGRVAVNPVSNSTALAIGIEKGDIISKINGYLIYDWSDVSTAIDAMTPGDIIKIDIIRNGKMLQKSGQVKSKRETKGCDDLKFSSNSNNEDNEDFDFDFDTDEEVYIAIDRSPSRTSGVDISGMSVVIKDMPQSEANEMREKYGVDMPVVSDLSVSQVDVFPNPSAGMFVLKFNLPQRGDTNIRIFNSLGREIYNYELSDFTGEFEDNIDISQNGTGSYFLAVTQNGKTMTKKILLQRG